MQFSFSTAAAHTVDTPCVVIGVTEDGPLSPAATAIDMASGGELKRMLDSRDIAPALGKTTLSIPKSDQNH